MAGKKRTATCISADDILKEAKRIEAQIRAISIELNNPELDLGASVRRSAKCRELEAYLTGLLYSLGGQPLVD
jgi:hypothetical protein